MKACSNAGSDDARGDVPSVGSDDEDRSVASDDGLCSGVLDLATSTPTRGARTSDIVTSDESAGVGRKPFETYPGSKDAAGAAETIIRHMEPHSIYVEAFLGGGAVMRRKTPALRTIGIERDPDAVKRWRRLKWPGLELIQGDAIAWLERHGPDLPADALVYADPPYLRSTRSRRRLYRFEMTDADHRRLLDVLDALPCGVILSGYPNAMYAERLKAWRFETYRAMTRGGVRTEGLWIRASSIVGIGVDARYAGKDFRDRQRIKRKLARWRGKFARLPSGERTVILQTLLTEFAGTT